MAYSHTTLADATAALTLRLSDPPQRFYKLSEQQSAIREALRVWNLLTSQDRARGFVAVVPGTAFYQLSTTLLSDLNDPSSLLRPQTIRDSDLLAEIKAHLLEDNLATDMFTVPQMVDAIQQSRDEFIADTALVLTEQQDLVPGNGNGLIDFPDSVTSIRRATFQTSSGVFLPLTRSDERSATAFNRNWQTPGTPRSYSVSATQSLRLQLIPPPAESGTLHTLLTESGPALDPTQLAPSVLGVPDDFTPFIKYGALETLFGSDGHGSDADRTNRAGQLYKLGVASAAKIASVLHVELDGRASIPAALYRTDRFRGGWEGKAPGTPNTLSMAGPDLVALTPVPDTNPHSLTLDVVRSALVPASPGDFLQVGRERLSAILGLAQWICVFKCGGEELKIADPYLQNFLEEAQRFAFQRSAASSAISQMLGSAQQPLREQLLQIDSSVDVKNAEEIRQERNLRRRTSTQ